MPNASSKPASNLNFSAARYAPWRRVSTAPTSHLLRLEEIIGMLCWGGFSAQSIASKSSPLQKLYAGDPQAFSALVSLDEHVSGSLSPAFSGEGYPRSDLKLIVEGRRASSWWVDAAPPNMAWPPTAPAAVNRPAP